MSKEEIALQLALKFGPEKVDEDDIMSGEVIAKFYNKILTSLDDSYLNTDLLLSIDKQVKQLVFTAKNQMR